VRHHGHHARTDPPEDWSEVKRLLTVLAITTAILALEIAGGLYSGSLALLADAGHVFGDSVAILATLAAAVLVHYGLKKEEVRRAAFFINIALLVFVVYWITRDALERIREPQEIESISMIGVAIVGGFGNYWQHRILKESPEEHKHEAHRALNLHILSDLFQSVGVVVGGILIALTGWSIIDPVLSLLIALWITYQIFKLLRSLRD
jgi:cobalt-zinc-cadmium efflux system protein